MLYGSITLWSTASHPVVTITVNAFTAAARPAAACSERRLVQPMVNGPNLLRLNTLRRLPRGSQTGNRTIVYYRSL